jgi:hypothetical protein
MVPGFDDVPGAGRETFTPSSFAADLSRKGIEILPNSEECFFRTREVSILHADQGLRPENRAMPSIASVYVSIYALFHFFLHDNSIH